MAGDVELAFRTAHRQMEVKINGQPDRLYRIGLPAKAPHASEFGAWQPIRTAAKSAIGRNGRDGTAGAEP